MPARKLPREQIEKMVEEAFKKQKPRTQFECCCIAASVSAMVDNGPWTDRHVLDVAVDMAKGLFGPSFVKADYGRKTAWVDMCERALKTTLAKQKT